MEKKYIVRLSDAEREQLNEIVRKFSGSSQKVRRAQILQKADAKGPAWTDARVAAQTRLRIFASGLSSLALPKHSLENSEQNSLARNA